MRRALSASITLCAFLILSVLAQPAFALPGNFDQSFGSAGFVSKMIDGVDTYGRDIAQGPGGKIYVSATSTSSPQLLDVLRYNANGTPDTSFSGDGLAQIGNSGQYINGGEMVVQPDGKPVVVGVGSFGADDRFIAARLNTDGTPDGTFGVGGFTSVDIEGSDYAFAVALQPDGKIVIAGRSASPEKASLARLTTGGQPDNTFGGGTGKVSLAIPSTSTRAQAVTVAKDGSIYIAGRASVTGKYLFLVAKFNSSGGLDPSFNGTGYSLSTNDVGSTGFEAIALQPDGKILASGAALGTPYKVGAVLRYLPSGGLDPGFAAGGVFQATPSNSNATECNGLALAPNGRISFACSQFQNDEDQYKMFAGRLLPNGSLDFTFGDGGLSPLSGPRIYASAAAIGADGNLLVTGIVNAATMNSLFAVRYENGVYIPAAVIRSPSKSKLRAKKLSKFSGTATPSRFVTKVELAVRKLDAKALKKKKQCIWLSSPKAKFSKIKDKTKACAPTKWRVATGTGAWSYKLKRKLPAGKYRLYVRVTLIDGSITTDFSPTSGNYKSFTLTKSTTKKKKKKK